MVLLNILLLILLLSGILFSRIIHLFIILAIQSRNRKKRTRKLRKFMASHKDFSKLLTYAESQGISLEAGIFPWLSSWSANPEKKIVAVHDDNTVLRPELEENGMISFAHEIAHIEYYCRRHRGVCWQKLKEKHPYSFFGCYWDEWLAWLRAEVILDSLGIKVDKYRYWWYTFIAVPTHIPCPLWEKKNCPKKEAIDRLLKKGLQKKIIKSLAEEFKLKLDEKTL